MMQTRLITFAGSSLEINYEGERASKIVETLWRYVPAEPGLASQVRYRLLAPASPAPFQLYREETRLYEGPSEGMAAELLLGDVCHHLAARSQNGLLFHAAALTHAGRGLMLPGATGAGKTTLTAWLARRGFDYLTDELVFIPWDTTTLHTLTRPLNLKAPARTVLGYQFETEEQAAQVLSSAQAELIPHTLFNPATTLSEPDLSLIIFPKYHPEAGFDLAPLSKAQAGLELMQTLINARNLPRHGFSEVARLARTTPAYKMTYHSFARLDRQIETLLT